MGTNYYVRYRYEEIHIGKSSIGWTFTFHATDKIRSYKQWITFLSRKDVNIFDEYGKKVSLKEFKKLVESRKDAEHNHAKEYPEGSYLDEKGNSMSEGEFD